MKYYLFAIYLLTHFIISAQTIIVQDTLTRLPIQEAFVYNEHDEWIATTNNSGEIELNQSFRNYFYFKKDGFAIKTIHTTKPISNDTIIYLNPNAFDLNVISVQGIKWKSKKENTAVNILSFTEEDIIFNQPQTMADALAHTGEVYVQKSQQGGGSPMMRGFATNRVLIVVDGIRMNNAIFRSGNVQNVIGIDPYTIAEANIIMGPGSVLYGSDAIGGVMDFKTEEIHTTQQFHVQGKLASRYSTASNEKTLHLDLSTSGSFWSTYSSFSTYNFGDLKMGKYGDDAYLRKHYVESINGKDSMVENQTPLVQKESAYKQINLLQKIKYAPNLKWDINYTFSFAKTSDVPRYDRLTRYKDGVLRSGEWYYGPQTWTRNSVTTNLRIRNKWFDEFSSILAHQYFSESRHDRDFNKTAKRNRYENVTIFSWDNGFYKKLNPSNELFYGLDLNLNHVHSTANQENILNGTISNAASRYPDQSNWNQFGVYAKEVWQVNSSWNFESGLRYSFVKVGANFNNSFYDFPFNNADFAQGSLSGSLGSTIKLKKKVFLNFNLATGFRAPNIDDLAKVFDSEPGNVVVPNPDLKPERIYSIEGGFAKTFGRLFKMNLNGYYTILQNALIRKDFKLNGEEYIMYDGELSRVQAVQNASNAQVYGGLLAMEVNLTRQFKFIGNINYTIGKEKQTDGTYSPLRHAAPLFGKGFFTYEHKSIKLSLESIFNGKIAAKDMPENEKSKSYLYALNDADEPYVPAFTIFNFKSQWNLNRFFTFNIGIENIFDRRYRPYSSGISGAGRNFVFSVQTTF